MSKVKLGVNVDHVATIRQARGVVYPDPVEAALIAEKAGADGITIHLREDRRHIQDHDVYRMKEAITTRLNLEMAVTEEMLRIACDVKPAFSCLVPEKREELTTEGGLDLLSNLDAVSRAVDLLSAEDILVSLFIDPDLGQIDAAVKSGAPYIELHTGCYAEAESLDAQAAELDRLMKAADFAHEQGLVVNAGHGLHYENTAAIAAIPNLYELNIGHSIVAQALMVGMFDAVKAMKVLL